MEFGKQRGNTSLDVWVDAPTYVLGGRDTLAYMVCSVSDSSWNPLGGRVQGGL